MQSGKVYVDDRVGSKDLIKYIPNGVLTRLDYADVAFLGKGPEDHEVIVGIERKRWDDLIGSMKSGRLTAHQLPGMLTDYDYCYLIVEGAMRQTQDYTSVPRGKGWRKIYVGAKHLNPFLNSLEVVTGIIVRQTMYPKQTAELVMNLYTWWQNGVEHYHERLGSSAHHQRYTVEKPSLLVRVASQLPFIGPGKSQHVAEHFISVREMVLADIEDWMQIDGIGRNIATAVKEAME